MYIYIYVCWQGIVKAYLTPQVYTRPFIVWDNEGSRRGYYDASVKWSMQWYGLYFPRYHRQLCLMRFSKLIMMHLEDGRRQMCVTRRHKRRQWNGTSTVIYQECSHYEAAAGPPLTRTNGNYWNTDGSMITHFIIFGLPARAEVILFLELRSLDNLWRSTQCH